MKAFCISHAKDVDGIGAASLAMAATGGEFLLSDYDRLLNDLDRVPKDADVVVISDLGTDSTASGRFVEKLGEIAKHAKVTYIDHHYVTEATKRAIRRKGVKLIHDVSECASMLTWLHFQKVLPDQARLIALYGAVTDYMDGSPRASGLMEKADRHFVLLEATLLSEAVARRGDDEGYPESLVRELSKMKHPHEIEGVPELAVEELRVVASLAEEVKREGKRSGRLAYMVTSQHSTGGISKLLIGAFNVPVGVALREKQRGWYEVSLRSTSDCRVHLGKTIGAIAARLGGNGGGHRKAAGARVPMERADEMLRLLAKRV